MITTAGPEPFQKRSSTTYDYGHYSEKQLAPIADMILRFFDLNYRSLTKGGNQLNLFQFSMSFKVPFQYLSVLNFEKVLYKSFSFQRILLIFLLPYFINFSEAYGYQNVDKKFQAKIEKVLASKDKLVLVIKREYQLYLYFSGKIQRKYEIALSQFPVGRKKKKGDLKVPEGEYKICEKAKGPFGNSPWWKVYFGPRWIKIN